MEGKRTLWLQSHVTPSLSASAGCEPTFPFPPLCDAMRNKYHHTASEAVNRASGLYTEGRRRRKALTARC